MIEIEKSRGEVCSCANHILAVLGVENPVLDGWYNRYENEQRRMATGKILYL